MSARGAEEKTPKLLNSLDNVCGGQELGRPTATAAINEKFHPGTLVNGKRGGLCRVQRYDILLRPPNLLPRNSSFPSRFLCFFIDFRRLCLGKFVTLASPKVLPLERTKEKQIFLWFFARLFVPLQL